MCHTDLVTTSDQQALGATSHCGDKGSHSGGLASPGLRAKATEISAVRPVNPSHIPTIRLAAEVSSWSMLVTFYRAAVAATNAREARQ